ncbi:type IV pilin protein [Vibrio parahaemolyticus]|uniref:type IV pilin protein n=1 Tax=Vibrio parahaemolyticus TaxID=670 RepID=UPI00226A2715|nr:prepilin-type N-terminal cleavage/methylation domain-containing protein [Vibrio parahaemolyticus]MCX8796215.1 prepilin-type N-terminal cleavage/methylation domain-containing protein [Vibrio parahaemolyticus]
MKIKKLKNQRGYTLMELMLVIAIMTLISIGVIQDRMAEASQLRAKTLGKEIATVATALQSYTGYYSGSDGAPGAPVTGTVRNGINFLKSNTCSSTETTSKGAIPVGFLGDCGYLSHITTPTRDQRTTFGNLSFKTTFKRTAAGAGNPGTILEAITVLDPLKGHDGVMMSESGLAALVAGGMSSTSVGAGGEAGYRVVYCVPGGRGDASYNRMCTGNADKIVIMTTTDATANIWLRTDGRNTMNNLITFGETVNSALRGLVNINKLVLPRGGQKLTIEQDSKVFVDIDKSKFDVIDANLTVKGTGYIKSETSIVAKNSVQSKVYLPFLGDGNENSTASDYRIQIEDKSEMKSVGLNGIYLGTTSGSRAENSNVSSIIAETDKDIRITSDSVEFLQITGAGGDVDLKGEVNVSDLNVELENGTHKSLAQLLPRYTLLGVQKIVGNGSDHVNKSTYELLGCRKEDMKPILVVSGMNVQGFLATDSTWRGFDAGQFSGSERAYAIKDPSRFITYGENIAYVTDNGSSWTAIIDGYSRGANHSKKGWEQRRYGAGLLHVYCLNDIKKTP